MPEIYLYATIASLAALAFIIQAKSLRIRRALVSVMRGQAAQRVLIARIRDMAVRRLKEDCRLTKFETREVAGTLSFLLGGQKTEEIRAKAAKAGLTFEDSPIVSDADGNMPQ